MLNYFIEKGHHQDDQNGQPLIFFKEVCFKPIGEWSDLALQKDNKFGDPRFLFVFLKGIIFANEIKVNI